MYADPASCKRQSDDAIIVSEHVPVDGKRRTLMIDGLKLTMTGEEIRAMLDERIRCHERGVERWKRELTRTAKEQTIEEPLLPDEMCANEAERHEWRIEVLGFLREHIEALEVYRVGAADLEFAELLAEKPGWLEQEEYEERTGVASNLDRLRRELRGATFCSSDFASAFAAARAAGEREDED
jgi:hypothetical protein